ncbi:hypothetical protein [Sulfurospirillum sp. 1612]|uniref:hypothetical protein n=1 Tax=Sulfurospirillum sp. 1612 TaxID=3094835 RepID=UPI002F93055B
MVIAYRFEYISTNRVLENFLKEICDEFKIDYSIEKDGTIVTLFVSGTEEVLHKFADFISFYLPLSIFLKATHVEAVDSMPKSNVKIKPCEIALPFSKKAITLAKDKNSVFWNNPFTPNEVGKVCVDCEASLIFSKNNNILIANNAIAHHKVYQEVAELIAKNEVVFIKMPGGDFAFSKVSKKHVHQQDDAIIIPTDLSNAQKMVLLDENEIRNLASIEKPIINARINSIYAAKGILDEKSVKIQMPNTILLQLICEELYKIGVDFVVKSHLVGEKNYSIDFEAVPPKIDSMEITVLENNEVLILKEYEGAPEHLVQGLEKLTNPAIRQYASILNERALFNAKTSCFYFSKTHDDAILFHDEEHGMLELSKFPLYPSIAAIFAAIEDAGETGKKLIKNYKAAFPEIFQHALDTEVPQRLPQNLFHLFAFASVILGLSEDFENGAEKLMDHALGFGGQKGPRIEFTLKEKTKVHSDFDAIKMIRSAMSFKLAGTDDATLSFGFLDSFSYFVSDIADAHKETLSSSAMTLGGSLFGYKRLSEMTCKNLLSSHKIYFNRELPIDNI